MNDDSRQRLNSGWQKLLELENIRKKYGKKTIDLDPVLEVTRIIIAKFRLKKTKARKDAQLLIDFLIDERYLQPLSRNKNGRITSFRLLKTKPNPDFSFMPALVNDEVKCILNQISQGLEQKSERLFQRLEAKLDWLLEQTRENGDKKLNIAVWLDGPNIWYSCEPHKIEVFLDALMMKLQQLGNVVFAACFNNSGTPLPILEIYKKKNFALIDCAPAKKLFASGFDPVDEEMKRLVRLLAGLMPAINCHVIGSADADFNPLIEEMRQRGKKVFRFFITEEEHQTAVLQEMDGDRSYFILSKEEKECRGELYLITQS